ncbi:MAG: Ig-like domain-containing protein [Tissierellia bacterium]|nr:Ig-like domain-containing protein [Tissierellia bacterium]
MKRKLSLLIAVVMILGSFSFAYADADFDPAEFLKEKGVLLGNETGDLMLDEPLFRRDAVIMLARLLGEEDIAANFEEEGLPTWEDNTISYYKPFLAWAQSNGYFQGHSEKRFGPTDHITAKEYAVVLLRALGYTEEANDWDTVFDTAKELGLLEGIDKDADDAIVRREMAEMTVTALATPLKDSEETLADKLNIDLPEPPEPPVVDATKVEEVYAENLKEIVVVFDGEVDKDSAESTDNYSLASGKTIASAVLSEDKTTVTLTLAKGKKMDNQVAEKLTVRNIKAGDKILETETIEFKPLDITLPEVVMVEALGNKAVKVVFSEPVQNPTISSFKINEKSVAGTVVADESNVVIIRVYTKLADGTHTLSVTGVKDFAEYVMLDSEYSFEVVEDTEPPVIVDYDATLEYVTVTFSEPVQDATVRGGAYAYWKVSETSTKKYQADSRPEKINDTTYRFSFSEGNRLPLYPVYFYVEGVKDYSDNVIAKDSPIMIEAKLDQTRPEIVYVKLSDNNDSIEVKFSKQMDRGSLETISNYTLLNEKGNKVAIKGISFDGDTSKIDVQLFKALDEGTYEFKMQGLTDNTALKNTILPYETTLTVSDSTEPKVESVYVSGQYIYVTFSEEMTVDGDAGIANLNNYFIKIGDVSEGDSNDSYKEYIRTLPEGTSIQVLDDGRTVLIIVPEDKINLKDDYELKAVIVQRVEDLAGNIIKGFSYEKGIDKNKQAFKVLEATLENSTTVVVEFNQIIASGIDAEKFEFVGSNVDEIKIVDYAVDGNKVTLILEDDLYRTADIELKIKASKTDPIKSVVGQEINEEEVIDTITDKVAPKLVDVEVIAENEDAENEVRVFIIKFTEPVEVTDKTLVVADLIVYLNDEKLEAGEFEVGTDDGEYGNVKVTIIKNDEDIETENVSVELRDGRYIQDKGNNAAEPFEKTHVKGNIKLKAIEE